MLDEIENNILELSKQCSELQKESNSEAIAELTDKCIQQKTVIKDLIAKLFDQNYQLIKIIREINN